MKPRSWGAWAAVTGGLLLTLFINYHGYLTDFNLVPGDQGDTRLVVFTLEHWLAALDGSQAPLQLNMFYPDRLALGYADGLILFAVPYVVLRILGLDYFTSYQIVLALLTAFGYAMYLLLFRKVLKVGMPLAVVGSVVLTSLNSMQVQIDIGKLLAFHFWPALVLLLHWYSANGAQAGARAKLSLAAFSALLGLLFFTSYYAAWYFLFSAFVFAGVAFLWAAQRLGLRRAASDVWVFTRARRLDLGLAVLVFAVALLPFVLTYAPLIRSSAERSFDLVLGFTPTVRDLVNVSAQNIVWSPLLTALGFQYGNREVQLGSPLLALLLFAIFLATHLWRLIRKHPQSATDRWMLILSASAVALIVLGVKVRGASLWYFVYQLVPGASALRAEGRILMVVDMIVVVAVIQGLDSILRDRPFGRSGTGRAILDLGIGLICLSLIVEQVNGNTFRLDKSSQLAFMSGFEKPPRECRAFFIANPSQSDRPIGYYQLDAMMVSLKTGLPTVNGYSGITPDTAFTLVPSGVEYQYNIMNWLRANGTTQGICRLDYQSKAFASIDVNAEYARGLQGVRDQYLGRYLALFNGVRFFVQAGSDVSNLYPQYLEEHGYLDKSLGYKPGPQYHWIGDNFWLGTRACGNNQCPAIGVVGSYIEIEDIIEGFGAKASEVYFPLPTKYDPGKFISPDARGELLLIFPLWAFSQ